MDYVLCLSSLCDGVDADCLLCLAASLSSAPLSSLHIPALFYMTSLCFYWLKSEVVTVSVLRSGELLLLKVGWHWVELIGLLALLMAVSC